MNISDLLTTLEKLPGAVMARISAAEKKFEKRYEDLKTVMADVAEMKPVVDALKGIDLSKFVSEIDALMSGAAQEAPASLTPQPASAALAPDTVATIAAQHGVAPAVVQAAADAHAAPAGAEPVAAATAAAVSQGASDGIAASIAQAVAAQAQPAG